MGYLPHMQYLPFKYETRLLASSHLRVVYGVSE